MGLALTASLIAFSSGCISKFEPGTRSNLLLPDDEQIETVHRLEDSSGSSVMTMTSLSTTFTIRRLGSVEFNGANLPILSFRDGGYIATQLGDVPSAAQLCAVTNQPASGMSVSVNKIGNSGDPTLVSRSEEGVLIGRNGNQEGFLVERPNQDGSRSIGVASWDNGSIDWIIDDGRVNTFGWLGPNGRVVYSTLKMEETRFTLAVVEPDGTHWKIPEPLPYSWVFPILGGEDESLFAVRLGDGYADMVHGPLDDPDSFRKELRSHRMSNRADLLRTSQMMSTSTSGTGIGGRVIPWYSYELGRMVAWDVDELEVNLLPEDSISAYPIDQGQNWLVTTPNGLDRITLFVSERTGDRLLDFPWITRDMSESKVLIIEPVEREVGIRMIEFQTGND